MIVIVNKAWFNFCYQLQRTRVKEGRRGEEKSSFGGGRFGRRAGKYLRWTSGASATIRYSPVCIEGTTFNTLKNHLAQLTFHRIYLKHPNISHLYINDAVLGIPT